MTPNDEGLLQPPLQKYIGEQASVLFQGNWLYECEIIAVDSSLTNHLWIKDAKGYEHLVHAATYNFLFRDSLGTERNPIDLSSRFEIVDPDAGDATFF